MSPHERDAAANLVLIGMRCTGKSAVGRAAAARLGRPLVDTDRLIAQRAGKTIKEIFAAEGEAGFRDRETAVVRDVTSRQQQVISTSGGVVLRDENVRALRAAGFVVLLHAEPDVICQRMQADPNSAADRPALTDAESLLQEMHELWNARRERYTAAAHLVVDTGERSVEEITEEVLCALRSSRNSDQG